MSAIGESSSTGSDGIDDYAEVDELEESAFRFDDHAQFCFKCKREVETGIWSNIGYVHEVCANTLTQRDIRAYHESFSTSVEKPAATKMDLKAGHPLKVR
ncbi:hypothetical protein [Simkania sp.]|uniref:hypothetical protein n=1 Tax=Simkania sp. TaxID=34094 RepID=UPI003B51A3A6